MNVFSQPGRVQTFTAPSGGVVSGTPVLIGNLLVVPQDTVAQTLPFAGVVEGVFGSLPKTTSQVWAEGVILYWDNSTHKFSTAGSTGQYNIGAAAGSGGALSAAAFGSVYIPGHAGLALP